MFWGGMSISWWGAKCLHKDNKSDSFYLSFLLGHCLSIRKSFVCVSYHTHPIMSHPAAEGTPPQIPESFDSRQWCSTLKSETNTNQMHAYVSMPEYTCTQHTSVSQREHAQKKKKSFMNFSFMSSMTGRGRKLCMQEWDVLQIHQWD